MKNVLSTVKRWATKMFCPFGGGVPQPNDGIMPIMKHGFTTLIPKPGKDDI